jgi:tetratricopeptide (TPR) repeat protein
LTSNPWLRAQELMYSGDYVAAADLYSSILESDRLRPMAWMALSTCAFAAGRYRLAIGRARTAAEVMCESGRYEILADLALHLQELGESHLAVQLINEADWSEPGFMASADRVAQCLALADQHAETLRVLDFVLTKRPATPQLLYMRATTLRHLGRSAEATTEFQRCVALAPDDAAAILLLAVHDPRADATGQMRRIQRALRYCTPEDPRAPMLHYALFIHLDAAGDTDTAWQALMRGATLKRQSLKYDAQVEQRSTHAMKQLCQPGFLTDGPGQSADQADPVPIFIVGMPRTGTTVLERMLSNHSQVASAGELNDFHQQLCWEADMVAGNPADLSLMHACRTLDFTALGRGYSQRTRWRAGTARFLIDKLPQNFFQAGLIHKALPQARIICLLRDPMDTCLSNLKELFATGHYPYSYDSIETANHYLRFRELLRHWDTAMPGIIHTVRYEDLVREPKRIVQAVMQYCGLAYEPGCIDLERNVAPSATASSSQIRRGLHSRSIGAWRRYAAQLAPMRARLQSELAAKEFTADSSAPE